MGKSRVVAVCVLNAFLIVAGLLFSPVQAETSTSTNYTLDGVVGNSLGGQTTSGNYQLVSSGGESAIGNGSSGSYKLTQGYAARLDKSLQLTVQRGNLAAYYPFDEGSGTRANDYTTNSQSMDTTGSTWGAGRIAGAIQTSTTNYGRVTQTAQMKPTTAITVEMWMNPQNILEGNNSPVLSSLDVNGGYRFSIEGLTPASCSANDFCFTLNIGGTQRSVAIAKTTAFGATGGTFVHVAGTYNGSVMKLYVNGSEVATANYSGQITHSTSAPLCLAGSVSGSNCVSAPSSYLVDELKIFSTALSPTEIKAEYDAQSTGVPSGLSFAALTPGSSQTVPFRTVVETDASNYSLGINQNSNLTSGSNTIPGVSGSIQVPVVWNEGVTKGLGFSIYGQSSGSIPTSWSNGNGYAAFPSNQTTFYSRSGVNAPVKDYVDARLRIDINGSQPQGVYNNQMTITGTMTP